MSVKKIFTTLIIVVACVIVGAIVLNVLLPNVLVSLVDQVELQIKNATGLEFDFNNNGAGGNGDKATLKSTTASNGKAAEGGNVAGFK